MSEEAKWYVVHTYSGYENKVKNNLEKIIANRHLEDKILEIRVPMQDVMEIKDGKSKEVTRKMFPGYVLINMVMNDDTWYIVRNTGGVTGFVGPGSKPVPLTPQEMLPLGILEETEDIEVDFEVGDTIRAIAGAWKDTVSKILSIDKQKRVIKIEVELFGRSTPVEIGFAEVVKL